MKWVPWFSRYTLENFADALEGRYRRKINWHRHYCWLPVFLPKNDTKQGIVVPGHVVWFDYVERKIDEDWRNMMPNSIKFMCYVFGLVLFFPQIKFRYRPDIGELGEPTPK